MTEQKCDDHLDKYLDITGCADIDIEIRADGKVLWVNTAYGCKLRICQINGEITINDKRKRSS